jgi:glutathione S-transferase
VTHAFSGEEFIDEQLETVFHPAARMQSPWFAQRKPQLKQLNPLINLPFVIDGEVVVTQSNACLAYLGRKFNM